MPPTSLSQTPFFTHLLSSLPSLRTQVKDAVTASMKSWLLEIRNVSGKLGQLAMEGMETRARRWKQRCERDPLLRMSRPGSAVEMVTNEKIECVVPAVSIMRPCSRQPQTTCLRRLRSISSHYTNASTYIPPSTRSRNYSAATKLIAK